MSNVQVSDYVARTSVTERRRSLWGTALRRYIRNRAAMFGLIIVLGLFLVAILAPWLAPYSHTKQDLSVVERGPSLAHWLGTDELGRDLLSRVIWGARTAAVVSTAVISVVAVLGVLMGAIAGYFGGWVDTAIMRVTDLLFAFPSFLLAVFAAATLRPTISEGLQELGRLMGQRINTGMVDYVIVLMALGLVGWPGMARLVRGQVLSLRERDFTLAARALGASDWRILTRHLLPNALSPVIIALSLGMGGVIMSEAYLSFVGLGVQPPEASWGLMIQENYNMWRTRPHLVLVPGLVLALVVFGFSFVGDGLNDAMNPRSD
ncbi:MAG: ABC transporter permease [Chloroflexi bacterium]|nr:ABC transporter permease [Chloroflexota bacterium]